MTEDFTMSVFSNAINDYIDKLKTDGLSDEDVLNNLSDKKLAKALQKLTAVMSDDTIDFFEKSMYEKVLIERTRAVEFQAHNEQIWARGFVASEAMYIMVLEFAQEYNEFVMAQPKGKLLEYQFRYLALREIHGRACQQFLEIIYLIKSGFADGAYARWRSLYELTVIAKFIIELGEDDQAIGEKVAKSYFDARETEDQFNGWAKAAPCFSKLKNGVTFAKIQEQCNIAEEWKEQYRLSCKITHASPQGTFGRLSNGPNTPNIIPVGHSDYGHAMPAINSALALSIISVFFFSLFCYGDSIVYMKITQKWAELVQKYYKEIESECFPNEFAQEPKKD